jgi:UDP-GlcNAc:undecaprenyl-phosphate/decaprenyl-phosphate GlcNAc-1-phosphate transferase
MITYLVAFSMSCVTALVLTGLTRNLAISRGWYDAPEARKVHTRPIPRIGGIAIAIAFWLPLGSLYFYDNTIGSAYHARPELILGLLIGSLIMIATGLWDDIRGMRASVKLALQIVAALVAWSFGYQIAAIGNPFGIVPIELGLLALPVTLLWIVAIVNAINLMDGLDGLAGGIALISVLTLFVVGVLEGNVIVSLTTVALAGALVGFLRHNFNPASIFMGDSGSLTLGYVLALTSISGSAKSSTVVSLLMPMLALGLPLMDTVLAVIRRWMRGRPIFGADRGHIHHRLLDLGYSHRNAVLLLYAGCLVLGIGALAMTYANSIQAAAILGAFGLAAVVLGRTFGVMSWDHVNRTYRYGRHRQNSLTERLERIHAYGLMIRKAPSAEAALDILRELAQEIEIDGLIVRCAIIGPGRADRFQLCAPEATALTATPAIVARHQHDHPLDATAQDIEITGSLSMWWSCEADMLHIPEVACYDWLALVLRDRLVELALAGQALPLTKRPSEQWGT